MELICPNCNKTYKINSDKIPPNITTAKCKACGHTMPLKLESSKTTIAKSNAHKITCLYCSRKYTIDKSKIPPNVYSVKCKACGHSILLKQTASDATHTETKSNKITCLYCNKTYTIDRSKIPDGISTTRCKSCGHIISLKPKHSSILSPKAELKSTGAYLKPPKVAKLHQSISEPQQQPSIPLWKKPWLLAAIFAMIVVGVTVLYSDIDFMKLLGGRFAQEQVTKPPTQYSATHLPKPFLNLYINVPLALESFEKHIPKEKKDLTYKTIVSVINSLDVNRIQLYLFPDSRHIVLPVILVHGGNNKSLEARVKKAVAIKTMLERMPDGSYRLKKEAMPAEKQNDYPFDLYRIHFSDKRAVIAPKSLLPELKHTEILQQTQVAQMAATVETSQDLAILAIRIPENFQAGWEKKIKELPGFEQNPQMAMMAAIVGGILSQMTEHFKKIETIALGFRFNGDTGRTLSYAQIFRKGVNGVSIYQQLNSGDTDDADVDGIVGNLIEVFKDPRYQQQIQFDHNRLALDFSWSETDDKAFFSALSDATIGQLMAQSMQLDPAEGPIITQYTDEPRLVASVNVDKLKKTIPELFQKSIYPGNYFDFGENPHMTLKLDTVDIPNAALAELTYDVLAVRTPDGKDVMRPEEDQFKFKIYPGSITPGHITLNIHKGIQANALRKANIRFHLLLPSVLEQLEFNAGDANGSFKKTNGIYVKLGRLEKDVAKVKFRGGKDARLFAYDKTGRALASQESMSTSSSVSTRFQGVIDKLKVVVIKETFDYPFEIDVDLNEGRKLSLSHMPEILKLLRFNRNPRIVAIPVDTSQPTFFLRWNQVYMKQLNGAKLEYLPQNHYSQG